jgi:hypothetical protein
MTKQLFAIPFAVMLLVGCAAGGSIFNNAQTRPASGFAARPVHHMADVSVAYVPLKKAATG